MHVESEALIDAPASVVFAYVADVVNDPEWQEAAIWTRQRDPGPIELGSRIDHEGRFLGMRMRTAGSVTAYTPDRLFGYDFTSRFGSTAMRYELESRGESTRLRLTADSPLPALMRPVRGLLQRNVQGMFDRDVARLRDAVERRNATT